MNQQPAVLTVQQITLLIKQRLEDPFHKVCVQGEVANLKRASSGHIYFSLIEKDSMLNAVLFQGQASLLPQLPKNGDTIIAKGEIVVFAARGSYQLIVRSMELAGIGSLLLAKQLLKKKLAALGWFAPERKRALPSPINKIGVITSPTGAVIRDIIHILSRRAPSFHLIINPVAVQGENASKQIAQAIIDMNRFSLGDVLIICRGGGSSEDLAAFDTEEVAKACLESRIPIISAVGHETDYTLLDLVADVRAPTPSAAAELASKEKKELVEKLTMISRSLVHILQNKLVTAKAHLNTLSKQLSSRHPSKEIASHRLHVSEIFDDIHHSLSSKLLMQKSALQLTWRAISSSTPKEKLLQKKKELLSLSASFEMHIHKLLTSSHDVLSKIKQSSHEKMQWHIVSKRNSFRSLMNQMNPERTMMNTLSSLRSRLRRLSSHVLSCNPLLPLSKGYALVKDEQNGVCTSCQQLTIGEKVSLIFSDGSAHAVVQDTHLVDKGKNS